MQTILDFLSFKIFISPSLFIIIYFLGAIIFPIIGWGYIANFKEKMLAKYPFSQSKLISIAVLMFIFTEILWRMMFEFLIAYFNIHDMLSQLN